MALRPYAFDTGCGTIDRRLRRKDAYSHARVSRCARRAVTICSPARTNCVPRLSGVVRYRATYAQQVYGVETGERPVVAGSDRAGPVWQSSTCRARWPAADARTRGHPGSVSYAFAGLAVRFGGPCAGALRIPDGRRVAVLADRQPFVARTPPHLARRQSAKPVAPPGDRAPGDQQSSAFHFPWPSGEERSCACPRDPHAARSCRALPIGRSGRPVGSAGSASDLPIPVG